MDKNKSIFRQQANWENLHFYQKAKSLYDITYNFTQRFLKRGDRTIDQMIQAARSGKQNIVEGSADGMTSSEMELNLINVARASIKELREDYEDYEDYLRVRQLPIWDKTYFRYEGLLSYCRSHDYIKDYTYFLSCASDEEIANAAITLAHLIDKMMQSYQNTLAKRYVEEGDIRERMINARLDYRLDQEAIIRQLQEENRQLKEKIAELEKKQKA